MKIELEFKIAFDIKQEKLDLVTEESLKEGKEYYENEALEDIKELLGIEEEDCENITAVGEMKIIKEEEETE